MNIWLIYSGKGKEGENLEMNLGSYADDANNSDDKINNNGKETKTKQNKNPNKMNFQATSIWIQVSNRVYTGSMDKNNQMSYSTIKQKYRCFKAKL